MPITAIMVILGASSRGAQLALICQLLVMNYRHVFNPKIIVSVAIALALIWSFLPDEQKQRFDTMGEDNTSKQRLLYWENGIEMIKEHPVLGVGYFNFAPYFQRYYPEDMLYESAQLPHNIFIQVGTDTGLLGVFVFVLMVFYSFKKSGEVSICDSGSGERRIGRDLNLSLLGFLIAGQFVTVTYYPFLWIHFSFVIAAVNVSKKR